MPVLPVPMIIALLLTAFVIHSLFARRMHVTLLLLIALCAVQSAIIALVQYYGLAGLRPVQAVMATIIPAVAWLSFVRAEGGNNSRRQLLLHAIGPAAAVACLMFVPDGLDLLIPSLFAGYGVAMLLRLGRSEDSLLNTSLEHGSTALWAWRILGTSLVASAVCDVLIVLTLAQGNTGYLLWLPSIMSSLSLLSLGALAISHAVESQHEESPAETEVPPDTVERDRAIVALLDQFVETRKPYLDPERTLARLARRLVVPAKQLSAAINRTKGENVSRYINRHRIEEACRRMANGANVTTAMLESGFNTKSNFNREFLRVKGTTPRAWIVAQKAVVELD